jgi:hypothetical protein
MNAADLACILRIVHEDEPDDTPSSCRGLCLSRKLPSSAPRLHRRGADALGDLPDTTAGQARSLGDPRMSPALEQRNGYEPIPFGS